ncbi:MAG TPA: fused MFS/spermidine synthase [Gemmatimonadaceae bacterium]|nr:fused MFS/spermidine synthase [Gemmatimonadaceae bacterium]
MLLFLCAVFVLSGAAGLIYESIWVRYLGLFVGHGAYAQVLVLVIFLGGMSAGALVAGRRTPGLREPLRWYAYVELAVGLLGLVFHDVFVWTTHLAYDSLFPALGPGIAHTLAKWTLAAILILPQSILLGATFPLMSAGVVRRVPERVGNTLSLLYFANSLGAAAGVLAAGFVLVGLVGLPGTLLVAAMANLVVALLVLVITRSRGADEEAPMPETAGPARTELAAAVPLSLSLRRLLLAVSFGTAISSFIYEIGWIRMLSLVLGSATHSFELMLSAFILGLACGAFAIRRRSDAGAASVRTLALVQIAMGVLAVATLPVYLQSFHWMADFMAAFSRTAEGYRAFSLARYFICLAVMLPATFCAGMTLPLLTRLLLRGGSGEAAIGQVYAVNTLGSIVGVAIAALVLLPLIGLKWLLVGGAAIDVLLGALLLALPESNVRRVARPWWVVPAAAGAFITVIGVSTHFDRSVLISGVYRYARARAPGSMNVPFFADGRTATISVRRIVSSTGYSLATNGKPDASLGPEWFRPPGKPGPFTHDASTQMLLPLVTLAHVPTARRAAVIGQGSGMSSHALLGNATLERLVTIEIEPEMLRASRMFYPANRRVFDDPRSTFAIDDARSYFASQGDTYDLILSEPSNPWVAGVSGLFTTEFYGHVARFLTPQGVLGQWLHLSEINDGLVLSVVRAVAEQFPSYALYAVGGHDILIVASKQPTLPTPDWSVLKQPGTAEDLRRVMPLTPAFMNALHVVDATTLAPLTRGGGGNSDFYPSLDLGAERTRYVNEGAEGMAGLAGERFALGPLLGARRSAVDGEPYTIITDVPRLSARELAARLRDGQMEGASSSTMVVAENVRALERLLASKEAPMDWHVFVSSVTEAEAARAGAAAGVADEAFFGRVRAYLARQSAPAPASAAVDFIHGLASWDLAEAVRASSVLVPLAEQGEHWLSPNLLREGTIAAQLRLGDAAGARATLHRLRGSPGRGRGDLRGDLLTASVAAAEAVQRRPVAQR